jgi:hypothetical protein
LPAIAGVFGSDWFVVNEALEFPAVAALQITPSALGYLLHQAATSNQTAGGLGVEKHERKINNASQFRIVSRASSFLQN